MGGMQRGRDRGREAHVTAREPERLEDNPREDDATGGLDIGVDDVFSAPIEGQIEGPERREHPRRAGRATPPFFRSRQDPRIRMSARRGATAREGPAKRRTPRAGSCGEIGARQEPVLRAHEATAALFCLRYELRVEPEQDGLDRDPRDRPAPALAPAKVDREDAGAVEDGRGARREAGEREARRERDARRARRRFQARLDAPRSRDRGRRTWRRRAGLRRPESRRRSRARAARQRGSLSPFGAAGSLPAVGSSGCLAASSIDG